MLKNHKLLFTIITLTAILLIVAVVIFEVQRKPESTKQPAYQSIDESSISNNDVRKAIVEKFYQEGIDISVSDITLSNPKVVAETWLIYSASITSPNIGDEQGTMTYIIRKQAGAYNVVSYTANRFDPESLPEYTPLRVINEANRL